MVADFDSDSWSGYEKSFQDEKLISTKTGYPDIHYTGKLKIHGVWGQDTVLTVKGIEHNCKTIIIYIDYDGTIIYQGEDFDVGDPYRITFRLFYGENVGYLGWIVMYPEHNWGWGLKETWGFSHWVTDFHIEQ